MPDPRIVEYAGPWDARNYELAVQLAGGQARADLSNLLLNGHRERHTNPDAEWGHGLYLAAVEGGVVEHVEVRDVVGDGVVLGSTHPRDGDQILGVCRQVHVRQLVVSAAQRNAVAFIGAERCTLTDATLVDTHGRLPRGPHAGIDFESDHASLPNVDNLVQRVEIAGCQGFGIVCDMGGPTCFGTWIRQSRIVAARTGWAILWRGGSHPQHAWHQFDDLEVWGPTAGLTHTHCRGVHFHSVTANEKSARALEIDHDLPVILEACRVDGLPLTRELAREHPAVYVRGARVVFRP